MAPARNDLGVEFEALRSPTFVTAHKQKLPAKSLTQRLNLLWSRLRRYG